MNLFVQLLRDEHGFVLSAESMLLGTVGVIGATVGLSAVSKSVNDELTDVAMAIRSVDQSFHIEGASSCGACVAGSSFTQTPVGESLQELREDVKQAKAHEQKLAEKAEKEHAKKNLDKDGDPQPPTSKKPHPNAKKRKKDREKEEDDRDEAKAREAQKSEEPRDKE